MYNRTDQFPDNMVLIVDEFVSELLRNGFTKNLIALLRDLCLHSTAGKDAYEDWEAELRSAESGSSSLFSVLSVLISSLLSVWLLWLLVFRSAIQILFVLFSKHDIEADDLIDLVRLIRQLHQTKVSSELLKSCDSISCAVSFLPSRRPFR